MKTLIVEDDLMTQCVLSQALTELGHEVVSYENAEQAILAYQKEFYPLLFVDAALPGMGGLQFCKWVRAQPNGDKVFIMVAPSRGQPADMNEILEVGANDFLPKPFGPSALKVRLTIAARQMQDFFDRKGLEDSLRQSQEGFHRIVKTASEGVWLLDAEFRTEYVNPQVGAILGCQVEELTQRSAFDFVADNEREDVMRLMADQRAGKESKREWVFRRKDGSECPVFVSATPVQAATGEFKGSLWMVADLTKHRHLENELLQTRGKFEAELKNLTATLDKTAGTLQAEKAERRKADESLQQARAEVKTLTRKHETETQKAQETLKAEAGARKDLEQALAETKKDLERRSKEQETARERVRQELEKKDAECRRLGEELQRSKQDWESQVQKHSDALAGSQQQLDAAVAERNRLAESLQEARGAQDKSRGELEQAEAKYRQEVAGSNRALEQLQAESGARLKELEAAVVDAEKQRDKESESRSRTEQELLTVREELAARLKKHTEELLGLNESLKAEMGERKRADEGLTEARAEFNRAAKAHTDELVATGEKLAALAQKRDELESRLSARGRELDEARKQLESQTAERLDFEQANQKAKDELATRLNENNRKLNELEEQLKRQNEGRQQVYARLGKALADCMTPTEAARVVSSSAQELFGWDACAIDLYSVDENRIHPVLNIDTVNGRSVDVPAGYLELGPTPLMQQVVREGPQLVLRKGSSGAHTDDILFGDRAGLSASMMCVPIRAGGKVTGFVSIQRYAPEAYNSDDLSGLEALADHLAGALERVRAEEIQRRSEERFRLVARATTDIVWDWNVPMNQIWRNDVFHTVFGYRPDEIEMGIESWESRLHPEDRERVIASLHRGLDHGEQVWSAEYRFRRADGSYAHVSDRGYAIRDKNHKAIRMVGAMVDISHHKQVEEAMIEGQARKGAILESAIDGIVTVDHEGRIFEWNPAAERMFGYRRVDVLGKELHQLIVPPALHEKYRREMGQHLAAGGGAVIGKRVELTTVRADASELPVELSISRIPTEGPPVFTGFIRDIAERKRAEMEIQKLVAFPRRNPNPVFEFAADGSLTYFNDAAQEMALSLGKEHPLAILPERTTEVVKDCLAKGQNKLRVETAINSRTISWSFFPIPTNHVVHCYAADITERTSLEAQLRQAQKMESVGQLAAGVAHDFNNILSVIQGYSALLMEEKNVKPETGEALKQINSATQRATHLTRQLLTFSRKQAMHVQTLDLNEVINSVSKLLRRVLGESIAAKFDFLSDLPPVEADTGMMEQIVMNLAINARDAMPNSGQLTVATNVSNIDEGYAEHNPEARPGRFVCLSVADSGCGMDEATLGRIFEPFFTTKPAGRGTGLGLATVYGIVKQHGGWIEVQSQIGKGTTFKIYLPASDRALTPVTESATRQVVRGGQETILLVEDEPAVLAMAGGILGRLGYTVHEAASGDHAVSVWAEHGSKIQLLLTDMVMPGELNGRQLAEKLLSERPELKVMYTSGYSVDLLGNGLASTKNFAFLQKPYHPDMLAMMVRNCLDAA